MKIFIKHLPNTLNYGSMMMGENLIYYLSKKLSKRNLEFYTDTDNLFHIERLRKATKFNKIYIDECCKYKILTNKIKYVRVIEDKIKYFFACRKANKFYDAIIFLGGDDFSEIYYNVPKDNMAIKSTLSKLKGFNKSGKLIMVGQTIGPYTGIRKKWAIDTFKDIKIYTRDDECADYMKEVLGLDVKKSRDLAYYNLGLQEEFTIKNNKVLDKYGLIEEKYITIVGTGLNNLYTKNEDNFIKSFVAIIKLIKKRYPDKKLVWLSHVVTRNSKANDNIILDKINKKHGNFINNNLIVIRDEILPVEARIILGYGKFTLTCRMHGAVSTFQMGKPAICLSYSPKYAGVIGRSLDMRDLIIESVDDKLWKKNIVSEVEKKLVYIDSNYDNIVKKIEGKVKECSKILDKTIDDIIAEIGD